MVLSTLINLGCFSWKILQSLLYIKNQWRKAKSNAKIARNSSMRMIKNLLISVIHSTNNKWCEISKIPAKMYQQTMLLKLESKTWYSKETFIFIQNLFVLFLGTQNLFSRKSCFVFLDKLLEESKPFYHSSATTKRATYCRNSNFLGTLISNEMNFYIFRKKFSPKLYRWHQKLSPS